MKLTMKQRKFTDNYLEQGNIFQSVADAGFSKSCVRFHVTKLSENAGVKIGVVRTRDIFLAFQNGRGMNASM